jgi:hypothetical protein
VLSDDELHALRDIERRLRWESPELVRLFNSQEPGCRHLFQCCRAGARGRRRPGLHVRSRAGRTVVMIAKVASTVIPMTGSGRSMNF